MTVESYKNLAEKFPHHNMLIMSGEGEEDGTGTSWGVSYSGGRITSGWGYGTGNHCETQKIRYTLPRPGIENNTYDDRIL